MWLWIKCSNLIVLCLGFIIYPNVKAAQKIKCIWTDLFEVGQLEAIVRSSNVGISSQAIIFRYPATEKDIFDMSLMYPKPSNGTCVSTMLLISDARGKNLPSGKNIYCLVYNQSQTQVNFSGGIYHVRSCDHTYVLDNIIKGIAQKGEWSHVIIIERTFVSTAVSLLGFLRQTNIGCDVDDSVLMQVIRFTKRTEDFVNVIVNCSPNSIRRIVKSVSRLEDLRFNWVFFNVDPILYASLRHLLRDGDNLVILRAERPLFQLESVLKKWLNEEELLLSAVNVYRCMLDCYQGKELTYVGNYSDYSDVIKSSHDIMPANFKQFYGRHLRIAYEIYRPFVYQVSFVGEKPFLTGIDKKLLDLLAEKFNFSYSLHKSVDGQYGILQNGSWNGMIGMVSRGEVDMAVSGVTITDDREVVVDFTMSYYNNSYVVMLSVEARRWTFIYSVFGSDVWLCVVCLPLTISFAIWIINVLTPRENDSSKPETLATLLFVCFGNMFTQGIDISIKSTSLRLVKVSYWLTIIILAATYIGNLTAHLSATKAKMPFTTLKGLADNKRFTLMLTTGTSFEELLKNAKYGVYKDLWDRVQQDPKGSFLESPDDAWSRLSKEPAVAFGGEKINLLGYVQSDVCPNCVLLPEDFHSSGYGLVLKRGSPYRRHFDNIIIKAVEAGLIDKWASEHQSYRSSTPKITTGSRPIKLEDLFLMFVVLASGISLSFIVLAVEIIGTKIYLVRNRTLRCSGYP